MKQEELKELCKIFSGEKLYGDDLSHEEIERWNNDEKLWFIWRLTGFRKKRFELFLAQIQRLLDSYSDKRIEILDVGGGVWFWENFLTEYWINKVSITILNIRMLDNESMKTIANKREIYKFIQGDALSLPFKDKSFDVVFSNSVIDHLYSFHNQRKFAAEVRRVGKNYFVQTGNKKFFFEPHYLTPFVHYFPKEFQKKIIRHATIWGLLTKPSQEYVNNIVDEIILSSKEEFAELFPDAEILEEKVLGFTKSFIAVKIISR